MSSTMRFRESVAGRHTRLDGNEWDDVYVVGDVHGCRETLDRLLDLIDPDDRTLLVFVGDLVRKGPDSHGVVEFVRGSANAVSVQGNNERKVVAGDASVEGITAADRRFLETLPVAVSWDDALVVHGGVDPRRPLREHSPEDLRTTRSFTPDDSYERPYWFERYRDEPRVFFGHTVFDSPFESPWAVGLDTGCVYGGELTAYRCETGEFVSVSPADEHRTRSEDAIVSPRSIGERRDD